MFLYLCVCMFEVRVPRQRDFVCWYSCVFVCLCVCMFQSEGFLDRESESNANSEGRGRESYACGMSPETASLRRLE